MDKRFDFLPGLFWIGLSIFAMVGSYRLELGNFREPGAGLMPFLIAAVLFLVAIPAFLRFLIHSWPMRHRTAIHWVFSQRAPSFTRICSAGPLFRRRISVRLDN
jgi:hypothetical protein